MDAGQLFIQIAIIAVVVFILYKVIQAIINISRGSVEIVQHGAEFTKIITKIGKKKVNQAIENAMGKIEAHRIYEEEKKKIILVIALKLNVGLDVAEAVFEQYLKNNRIDRQA
jgi:hypothetical protein